MNMEQRLIEVFQTSHRLEPTPDLFSRVVHSIEEDRRHRRRVVRTVAVLLAAFGSVVAVAALSLEEGRYGRFVHRPIMEALEALVLVTILVVLGPAIRKFGRGYAHDLWPRGAVTPDAILRLLDLAYYLVGAGYVLLSTEFEFTDGLLDNRLPEQIADAAFRIGGLILALGLLHAATLFLMPVVALIDNSTRRSVPLPRWVILLLVLVVLGMVPLIQGMIGLALFS